MDAAMAKLPVGNQAAEATQPAPDSVPSPAASHSTAALSKCCPFISTFTVLCPESSPDTRLIGTRGRHLQAERLDYINTALEPVQ